MKYLDRTSRNVMRVLIVYHRDVRDSKVDWHAGLDCECSVPHGQIQCESVA